MKQRHVYCRALLSVGCLLLAARAAAATELYVAPGSRGDGSATDPFGLIQDAINAAQPGDVILVRPGAYAESIDSVRDGLRDAPIIVRSAEGRGSVVVTAVGVVLQVYHEYFGVDGLVLDGQYGPRDTVQIYARGNGFTLRNTEVRRSGRDCVDMLNPDDVTIEGALIHHCLNPANGRTDAHGVSAGGQGRLLNLTIRDTEIHTFSGDAIQVDPNRAAPGWDNLLIERCRLWLAPLAEEANGFPAGSVPGENALDTKVNHKAPRARVVVRDTLAWGFRNGMIHNMAAFNVKENVDAVIDGVTVWDSEIAFRLRGPTWRGGAWVLVRNSVIHDVDVAVRYEDNLQNFRFWNNTVGAGVRRPLHAAGSPNAQLDLQNNLFVGGLPDGAFARRPSNLGAKAQTFVNMAGHDYHLRSGSGAIDAGVALDAPTDRDGIPRPAGRQFDVGAYEYCPACTVPAPTPPAPPSYPSPPGTDPRPLPGPKPLPPYPEDPPVTLDHLRRTAVPLF
jgi:hypothetical protein